MKFEIEAELGVISGLPSLDFIHPSGAYSLHLENHNMQPGTENPSLIAYVTFEEGDFNPARSDPGTDRGSFIPIAKVGDEVGKGQTLFTIDSPDLLQAESSLIAAAGMLDFTTRNLARLKQLYASRAVSQREVEQLGSVAGVGMTVLRYSSTLLSPLVSGPDLQLKIEHAAWRI